MFKDMTILITGGTGSFGNAVLNRFIDTDVNEIRIISRDEKKQDDMRQRLKGDRVKYIIGDVRDYDSVDRAMQNVDLVFHAAALKQVPSCEFYPIQAVKTNIIGTENVLKSALFNKIKKLIVLSTDKAVYPINVMGMTKAVSEKVMVARSRDLDAGGTLLCATRYGNVMASRGSVIPLFVDQILKGQPITITDPTMTRFMMSLDEAIELVIFAYEKASPGDILVRKAPAATIEVLAQALKQLFDVKNEIRVIGTRHGEKKFETLVNREELSQADDLGNYLRIKPDARDLNYNKYFVEGEDKLSVEKDYTSHNTRRLDVEEMIEKLKTLEFIQKSLQQM